MPGVISKRRISGLITVGTGRYSGAAPAEKDTLFLPARWPTGGDNTVPGIVYCHGAGGNFTAFNDLTLIGQRAVGVALASQYPVVVADIGGQYTWGNPTAQTRIEDARLYLQSVSGCKTGPVILAGTSMGGLSSLNYASANPANVLGVIGIIPVVDLESARTIFGATVETAWGIGAAGTFPALSNPAIKTNLYSTIPIKIYNASSDVSAPASLSNTFASAVNRGSAVTVSAQGHSEASIAEISTTDMLNFIGGL